MTMMPRSASIIPLARRVLLVGLVLLWAGAFAATHIPVSKMPELHASDKTLHVLGYFALGGVFHITLAAYGIGRLRRSIVVVLTMAAYGALDEITQPLVNRCAAFGDWLADLAGAAAAVLVLEAFHTTLLKRKRATKPG